jgi:hypothetical protein
MVHRPLRQSFSGSIRSGTLCAAIPLSKNSARKSSRKASIRRNEQNKQNGFLKSEEASGSVHFVNSVRS